MLGILILGIVATGCSTQSDVDKMLSSPEVERKAKAALLMNNGFAKYELGDKRGAIDDYNQAIIIDPQYAKA